VHVTQNDMRPGQAAVELEGAAAGGFGVIEAADFTVDGGQVGVRGGKVCIERDGVW
jgi:hypothetical protein